MKYLLFFHLIFSLQVNAYDVNRPTESLADTVPSELVGVGVTEHLGAKLDLGMEFTNEAGELVPLKQYFHLGRPVLMTMVYYNCPHLCNFQLNGLLDVLAQMKGVAGVDYDVVAVSMDHKETSDLAAKKKATYMKVLDQPAAEKGWHFLVGDETTVKKLADQLGFGFRWNENLKEYAHSAAMYVLTPFGEISRYLYGIEFSPQTLRLSLVEASKGMIGDFVDQVSLLCFQFDPNKKKYTIAAFRIMQAGAAVTVVLLLVFLVPIWRRERNRKAPGA